VAIRPTALLHRQTYALDHAEHETYWVMTSLRLTLFLSFVIFFYSLMYLVNNFVDDMPEDVGMKMRRRAFLVAKYFEADALLQRTVWARKTSQGAANSNRDLAPHPDRPT